MNHAITRRGFLGKMLASLALTATGCAKKIVWPAHGSEKGSVRLVFFTDIHARTEWETSKAMARAARLINAQKADLVIAGGDLITDGFQSSAESVEPRWDAYMEMHQAIEPDVYPAMGNHDLVAAIPNDGTPEAQDPRKIFREKMNIERTYYSFDAVGYHIVVLDAIQVTGDDYQYQGKVWPEELEWLRHDLSRVPHGTPIIMVSHIPLLTAFYVATEGAMSVTPRNRVVINNRDVFGLMEDHNVILVLQGHLHAKELLIWRDTTFVTGGAVCARWWRGPWHGTEEGFNVITLTGNHVEWEYIDYGWEARRPDDM